jgi:signal peptidase II
LGLAILVSCLGCDQATKRLATQSLRGAPRRSYLADLVRLEYALNPGGFLSLGAGLPGGVRQVVFLGVNACLMLGLAALLALRCDLSPTAFVALVGALSGGMGNFIDRLTNQGFVIDFINLGWGPILTGIFNLADVAVTLGGLALVLTAPGRLPAASLEPSGATAASPHEPEIRQESRA